MLIIVLSILAFSSISQGEPGDLNDGEVVFLHIKTVDKDGNVLSEDSEGSPFYVNEMNQAVWYDKVGVLEDGSRFAERNIIYSQDSETHTYLTKIIRVIPENKPLPNPSVQVNDEEGDEDGVFGDGFLEYLNAQPPEKVEKFLIGLNYQNSLNFPSVNRNLRTALPGFSIESMIARMEAIEERKAEFITLQNALVAEVNRLGGIVKRRFWIVNAIEVEMKVSDILAIAEHRDIATIEKVNKADILTMQINIKDVRKSTQTEYFRRSRFIGGPPTGVFNFEGKTGSEVNQNTARIYVAVIDNGLFNLTHYAFNDTSTPPACVNDDDDDDVCLSDRILQVYHCIDEDPCIPGEMGFTYPAFQHHQFVTGIIAGDLTENQDPDYDLPAQEQERLERTGIAPEVELCLLSGSTSADTIAALEAIVDEENGEVDIINHSMGFTAETPENSTCGETYLYCPSKLQARGRDLVSSSVNAVFEDDIFFVNAAGNQGDTCECNHQISPPGNASGSFTVGSYNAQSEDPDGNFMGLDDDDTESNPGNRMILSSTGPTYDLRIKPDIITPTWILHMPYAHIDNYNYGEDAYMTGTATGTSSAAPVLSGAAAILKDFFVYKFGASWSNMSGKLFVNLLNFGDRRYHNGEEFAAPDEWDPEDEEEDGVGFSEYYGAGRLRLRLPVSAGLDYPYRWETGFVELEDDDSVSIYIGNGEDGEDPIPDAADLLKVALWWHEPNTQNPSSGPLKAQITMALCRWTGSAWGCISKNSNNDQKIQFINDKNEDTHANFNTGAEYKLVVAAPTIEDEETRTVFWAVLWEDLARNDLNGPWHGSESSFKYLFYR